MGPLHKFFVGRPHFLQKKALSPRIKDESAFDFAKRDENENENFTAPPEAPAQSLPAAVLAAGAGNPAFAAVAPAAHAGWAEQSPMPFLLQADSGEVLAEKDADSTIYPASMTKMMTALLAIEANPDLDTPVTLPEEIFPALQAQNASLAGFRAGETATVRDLLYGAMLPSGAECCETLAREVSGSEEAFVARMNQRAKELGCTSTSFTCVHGLYDYGNVSSAHDLALIAKACAENETYMQVANTLSYTLPATNLHQNERTITSTNLMLNPEYPYYRDYIRGMKTGFTTLAGRCYVTFAQKDGHTYGLVVLGSDLDNIYREASEILDWAFASFSDRELVDTETPADHRPP